MTSPYFDVKYIFIRKNYIAAGQVIEIDNVSLMAETTVAGESYLGDSNLNIAFNKSDNLMARFEELLGYNPEGYYKVTIHELGEFSTDDPASLVYESEDIQADMLNNQYSHNILLNNYPEIPQNTALHLGVTAHSTSVFNNMNVFDPNFASMGIPFSWGTIEAEQLHIIGDANNDGNVTIADLIVIINIILGWVTEDQQSHVLWGMTWEEYSMLGDINEDGNLSIADIIMLVNIILGN